MRYLQYTLALLLTTAFISACWKKPRDTERVTGKVLEYGTLTPLEGAKVYLSNCNVDTEGYPLCPVLDSALTDSNGSYCCNKVNPDELLFVNAFQPGYFTDWETARVVVGEGNNMDIVLYPHAWLHVTIKNESGAYGFYPPGNEPGNNPLLLMKGEERFLGNFKVEGNKSKFYGCAVLDSMNSHQVRELLLNPYCPGHDTTDLYIVY